MSRYLLLFLLNAPLTLYGLIKAIAYYKDGLYNRSQLFVRVIFWGGGFCLLALSKVISDYLDSHHLTESPPLSLTDVVLATASLLGLTLIIRLYGRLEKAEKKIADLNEALALKKR